MSGLPTVAAMPAIPARWAELGINLRPEMLQDADFILDLFVAVRSLEFAAMGWPATTLRAFLANQSRLQNNHYAVACPGLLRLIIAAAGTPVGRIYLCPCSDTLRIVDISLLPNWRGRGLGTDLLAAVQTMAAARGVGVGLSVRRGNPAARLYRRHGFVQRPGAGLDVEMHWPE